MAGNGERPVSGVSCGGIGIVGRLDSGSYEAAIPGSYLGRRPGLQSAARRADDARPVRSRAFGLDAEGNNAPALGSN